MPAGTSLRRAGRASPWPRLEPANARGVPRPGAPNGWVVDGNDDGRLNDLVTAQADTIVWLDLAFPITFLRLSRRTLHRIHHRVELWNGNRETWWNTLASRDSILLWMILAHRRHRREWPGRYGQDPRLVRLRTRAEVRRWLDQQSRFDTTETRG